MLTFGYTFITRCRSLSAVHHSLASTRPNFYSLFVARTIALRQVDAPAAELAALDW
jgi:hypothetical protein